MAGIKATTTCIGGALLLEPRVFADSRGFFLESYNQREMESVGIAAGFVQDNHSFSEQNVVRGLHYQVSSPQGKLVRVVSGEIFDVGLDLRRSSPTFGKWYGVRLSEENKRMVWVPIGLAHGFSVLSPKGAHVVYKTTAYYAAEFERTVAWDDPELAIDWQLTGGSIVSPKDRQGKRFRDAELFDESTESRP